MLDITTGKETTIKTHLLEMNFYVISCETMREEKLI